MQLGTSTSRRKTKSKQLLNQETMKRGVYDWASYKAEYLSGDVKESTVWLRQKLGLPPSKRLTSTQNSAMRGWSKEWLKVRDKIAKQAIVSFGKNKAKRLAEALENIQGYFEIKAKDARLRVDDAEKVWKILRVENGLPANISKNVVTVPEDPDDALNTLQDHDDDRSTESQDSQEI